MYVRGITEINLTERARDRKGERISRRTFSYKYFLNVENKKLRVCKNTFLSTLSLGEWMVLNWLNDEKHEDSKHSSRKDIEKDVAKTNSANKKRQGFKQELTEKHDSLKEFFLSLPKLSLIHI